MFPTSTERERENAYSKRENVYPYDEREYFRRTNTEPYLHEAREREERDREYRYRQTKRDWVEREYHPYELNPSPGKRRKLVREDRDFYEKRDYYSDKREYYERDQFAKTYSSSYRDRERENDYTSRSNFNYREHGSRNGPWEGGRGLPSSSVPSLNAGSKYERVRPYDNGGYRRESSYDGEYRTTPTVRSYEREERETPRYDKYERDFIEKTRDPYFRDRNYEYVRESDRDREHSRERELSRETTDLYDRYKEKERGHYSLSPRDKDEQDYKGERDSSTNSSASSGGDFRNSDDAARNELNIYLGLTDDHIEDKVEEKLEEPTPKKRLGWGQGLMTMQKKKEEELSTKESETKVNEAEKIERSLSDSNTMISVAEPMIEERIELSSPEPNLPELMEMEDKFQQSTPVDSKPVDPRTLQIQELKEVPSPPEEKEPVSPLVSKEEVLISIERVDAEISKTEMLIHNLNKPKKEHKAHNSSLTLWEQIYEDNREKVAASLEDFVRWEHPLMKDPAVPLYKEPNDLESYKQNQKKHASIRSEIAAVIWRRRCETKEKEESLTIQYKKLHEKWRKKIQMMEEKRKRKEQKLQRNGEGGVSNQTEEPHQIRRPILRSQVRSAPSTPTLTTPRSARSFANADAVRSDLELDEILSQLREEDDKDPNSKYIKTIAKVPAMILDQYASRFVDKNGLVEDPMALERERKMANPWTDSEKAIFLKKFTQHPKNFSKIATYLENKTTPEVIWYYYANKKTLDLKKILTEQTAKRRGLARKMPLPTQSSNVPRELANLGVSHQWLSETGRVQRASVRNVNYNENKDDFEQKSTKPSLMNTDPDGTKWTENEKELFLDGLARYAKDFRGISNFMGTKTEFQCQNYYHNNKKKLSFDQIIEEGIVGREKAKKKKLQNLNPKQEKSLEDKKVSTPKEERRIENSWSEAEKADFLKYFKEFGKNWKKIGTNLTTKSQNQIKYYYQVSREKLKLDELEPEEFVGKKRGRKPATDKGPRKIRRVKSLTEEGDSLTQSPMIAESSPMLDENSRSPPLESSTINIIALSTAMSSFVERAHSDLSCSSNEEVSKDETLFQEYTKKQEAEGSGHLLEENVVMQKVELPLESISVKSEELTSTNLMEDINSKEEIKISDSPKETQVEEKTIQENLSTEIKTKSLTKEVVPEVQIKEEKQDLQSQGTSLQSTESTIEEESAQQSTNDNGEEQEIDVVSETVVQTEEPTEETLPDQTVVSSHEEIAQPTVEMEELQEEVQEEDKLKPQEVEKVELQEEEKMEEERIEPQNEEEEEEKAEPQEEEKEKVEAQVEEFQEEKLEPQEFQDEPETGNNEDLSVDPSLESYPVEANSTSPTVNEVTQVANDVEVSSLEESSIEFPKEDTSKALGGEQILEMEEGQIIESYQDQSYQIDPSCQQSIKLNDLQSTFVEDQQQPPQVEWNELCSDISFPQQEQTNPESPSSDMEIETENATSFENSTFCIVPSTTTTITMEQSIQEGTIQHHGDEVQM